MTKEVCKVNDLFLCKQKSLTYLIPPIHHLGNHAGSRSRASVSVVWLLWSVSMSSHSEDTVSLLLKEHTIASFGT